MDPFCRVSGQIQTSQSSLLHPQSLHEPQSHLINSLSAWTESWSQNWVRYYWWTFGSFPLVSAWLICHCCSGHQPCHQFSAKSLRCRSQHWIVHLELQFAKKLGQLRRGYERWCTPGFPRSGWTMRSGSQDRCRLLWRRAPMWSAMSPQLVWGARGLLLQRTPCCSAP